MQLDAARRAYTQAQACSNAGLAVLALGRIPVDIFPRLNLPTIYIAQPYGGITAAQLAWRRGYRCCQNQ